MRGIVVPLVALVLALTSGLLVYRYTQTLEEAQQARVVLKLAADTGLPAGSTLGRGMLVSAGLPDEYDLVSELAIDDTPNNREWLTGRPATTDVPAGAILRHDHFVDMPEDRLAAAVRPGYRAVTLPVNDVSAVGYFVEPGSEVDVVGTFEQVSLPLFLGGGGGDLRQEVQTSTILQNVRVIAVGDATTRAAYLEQRGRYRTVTVEVTPSDAATLAFAFGQIRGGLILTLRNPADDDTVTTPAIGLESLP